MTDIPLTSAEIRQLLRECVTVVKPGEILILRGGDDWTPEQVSQVGEVISYWMEGNAPHIKALVIPPMEIAILEHDDDFMSAVSEETFRRLRTQAEAIRLTHLPTGVIVEADTRDEAVLRLKKAVAGHARRQRDLEAS